MPVVSMDISLTHHDKVQQKDKIGLVVRIRSETRGIDYRILDDGGDVGSILPHAPLFKLHHLLK